VKKNLWFVFVALAMVAIFTVAGCKPTTPTTPTPTPTATPAPTVAPDTACPKVVSTVVSKIYDYGVDGKPILGAFKIVITFDEPIESDCVENPDNWTITVSNSGRQTKELDATPYEVTIDGKKLIVKATVEEEVTYSAVYIGATSGSATKDNVPFYGLICNTADADDYADGGLTNPPGTVVISSSPAAPTVADVVKWELNGCFIYDELGNGCCTFSGSDCCLEPVCETCVEECPLGSSTCQ